MLSIIIGIVGGVFGLASVILASMFEYHRRKYPKRMKFYVLDAVRLTNPMVDSLKNIKLEFNNRPITQTVSYIKGIFYNEGSDDVELTRRDTEEGLSLILPDTCKWLSVNIKEQSPKLNVSFDIDANNPSILHVSGGVFKREEIFSFEAFVEGELTKQLIDGKQLVVSHRFCNTAKTKVETMFDIKQEKSSRLFLRASFITSLFFMALMAFFAYSMATSTPVRFIEKGTPADSIVAYAAYVCQNDSIAVVEDTETSWPWNPNRYSLEEFNSKYELSTYVSKQNKPLFWLMIFLSVMFVLTIVMVVWIAIIDKPRKNILKVYTQVQQEMKKSA